ncbi:MAG: DinB family protein [Crocinitomicaceae bacterium]|nr:DinB family protein [Crocinitomicaceae bacterium]
MTSSTSHIAKHLREIHVGGNWTYSNLQDQLSDVTWQQATTQVHSFNTIATLVFHINYYVSAAIRVLEGEELNSKDELSFDHPPFNSKEDWDEMLEKVFSEGEKLADLIEQLPDEKLSEDFTDKKYGLYFRNLFGIVEHTHYHLGQIALIKKLVAQIENQKK